MRTKKDICYNDITGNVILGWRCSICKAKLYWFRVLRYGLQGKYE